MTLHPSLLVPALLLLWFPADRLLSGCVELRDFDSFHTLHGGYRHRPWWWVPALWVDPFRGFGGAWLLLAAMELKLGRWAVLPTPEFSVAIGVVAVGVLAQVATRRERDVLLAPIGFVIGIIAAFAPWYVTAIAVTLGVVAMAGIREFYVFFLGAFAAVSFLAFALEMGRLSIVGALVASGLPALAGLVTGRTLELPTRNSTGPKQPPSADR